MRVVSERTRWPAVATVAALAVLVALPAAAAAMPPAPGFSSELRQSPPPPSGGAQHSVSVRITETRDSRGKRATQLVIDVVGAEGPPDVEVIDAEGFPSLHEAKTVSPTQTVYTHPWSCDDGGRWRWRVTSTDAIGAEITRRGEFVIPKCTRRPRHVTQLHARKTVARDLGARTRWVRCAAGRLRRGQRAAVWRCTIRRPGYVCTGTLVLRFSEFVQAGEVTERRHKGSGEVNCVR